MRKIGTISSSNNANRFQRYLTTQGIASKVIEANDQWNVWVLEESQLETARQEIADFQLDPASKKYETAEVKKTVSQQDKPKRKIVRPRGLENRTSVISVTMLFTILSFWITIITEFGENSLGDKFMMASRQSGNLSDVMNGEVWRLFTPMFLHLGTIHLMFNMYMFWLLGSAIELKKGNFRLLGLILFINFVANFSQYFFSGPFFGGMSGVIYGLFGYLWMRSTFLPSDEFFVPSALVNQMLLWAVICILASSVFPVANAAHIGGLVAGMVIGIFPRLWRDR